MKSMRKRGGGGGRKAELERSDVNIAHRPHRNEREWEEKGEGRLKCIVLATRREREDYFGQRRRREEEKRGLHKECGWGIREFHDWIDRSIGRTDPTNSSDSVASP